MVVGRGVRKKAKQQSRQKLLRTVFFFFRKNGFGITLKRLLYFEDVVARTRPLESIMAAVCPLFSLSLSRPRYCQRKQHLC